MRFVMLLVFIVASSLAATAQQPCVEPDLHASALRTKAIQTQMLASNVGFQGMDTNVAQPLQTQIHAMKDTLATVAASSLQCAPETADAAALEATLAAALGANQPQPQSDGATDDKSNRFRIGGSMRVGDA